MKTVAKHFFALAKLPKRESHVNKSHAMRLKKYWGYFLKQKRCSTLEEMRNASKAPLNHLFDDHQHCDISWCLAKQAKEKGWSYVSKDGPFLNKKQNMETYLELKKICDQFSTDEKLKQSLHYGDTQANESFNNQLSYLAPKNINFSQSKSLSYRLALCISFHNEGYLKTWKHVYSLLGITISRKLAMNLKNRDLKKLRKKQYTSTANYKRKRKHKSNAKILASIMEEQRIEALNLGNYGPGIGERENWKGKKNVKPAAPQRIHDEAIGIVSSIQEIFQK